MVIFIIWIIVLIAVLTIYLRKTYSKFSDQGVKHLKVIPLFGNMFRVIFHIEHISADLDRMYQDFPNERFIGKYEFVRPVLYIRDLELVKKITIKDFEYFIDHRSVADEKIEPLFARNLIALKGKLSHDEKGSNETRKDTGFATVEESSVGKSTTNRVWSDTDLVAQAVLFFIAGFETISVAMAFALHEVAAHPEIQERLAQEIKEHNVKNGGKLDFNSIQNMTYMDMVASEVLRLWPPAMNLDRICVKDYNLGKPNSSSKDYIIRKGELLAIPVWSFHRDPKYFPNPDKFDPERFSDENKHNIDPIAYMPFGLGPRNCIGSRFALCELKTLLYQIILHMEVSPSETTRIPGKISPKAFQNRLEGGHWLRFNIRN